MVSYTTESIRNIALAGHGAAGKTTLVESILHHAGKLPAPGAVEKGNTVCDFDPQEKAHQHSLDSALVNLDYHDAHINLIDTPGFPDFLGQAIAVLPAVETVAVVINAQTGIESVTQRIMERAGERGQCRMIVVNKIDAENLNLAGLVSQIQDSFGKECLPINLPAKGGAEVVDCFFNPVGDSDFSSVANAHSALIDQVVEMDEELMALYLDQGEDLQPNQLHAPFEKALREGHLIPICFVSARTGAGVKELLDVFVKLLPNPTEGTPEPFLKGEGKTQQVYPAPDPQQHVIAHVFKVVIDPFIGKLGIFRIYQGTLNKDNQLYIGDGRKPFKVSHLFHLHGKEHPEVMAGIPGDICAVAKVDDIHRSVVLHDSHDDDQIHPQPLRFPTPLFGLAIRAATRGDEQKLSDTVHKLLEEDPCLALEHNAHTKETVLRGLSDLHLRITLEKMQQRYNLQVETKPPKIAYKETVSQNAEGHHRHKKQTGGAGQFGEVYMRIEPLPRDAGFEFVSAVVGGTIPTSFLPAVEKGVREALQEGAIAGYPMQDVRAIAYDGKYHPVDSKEIAFITAGREAFLDAVSKAKPLVLEPIVNLQVRTPADSVGAITGDLSSRRGRIAGTDAGPRGMSIINAQVPLAELEGYESQLKSMTGGHGSYNIELSHYDPVPGDIQQKLQAAHKKQQEN
ncbi:MAG: elongation factor G [Candidatus Competibacteraceae bacterium]|nr:elongation factor G [Candidatus Competibacteraceae bacterium]MBK7983955.1 elongation factor G [Candidatus Competibacteraceae bacterium]MBK8897503.1 elongation factor G [Candidatus Competibacteraceae bacterium]MBK8963655.1 elongation factor G [Candidatus Competibacteraceae bacterium]MBK9950545.1 elongation factor G [Candidatus Competibacteraceae bacterium]